MFFHRINVPPLGGSLRLFPPDILESRFSVLNRCSRFFSLLVLSLMHLSAMTVCFLFSDGQHTVLCTVSCPQKD